MSDSKAFRSTDSARLLLIEDADDVRFWDTFVDSAPLPDVYYRPGYLLAYEAAGHGRAAALVIKAGGSRLLCPLLLRPLSGLAFAPDVSGFDAATPYGYGGLILADSPERLSTEQVCALLLAMRSWCRENGVISLLLRLHPMLRQQDWLSLALDDQSRLRHFGPTTALDLGYWNEAAHSITTLHKGRRSDLSYARRNLHVTWASHQGSRSEDLRRFYDLYEQRMDQLHAGEFYHFAPEYYSALADGLGDRLDVAVAWLARRPVGAAIFMADRKLAHYHLSAANESGRVFKAMTLIINSAADWARKRGCQYLHLGGGASGEDNLFAFKQSFGGELFQYSFLTIVNDRERYDELLRHRMAAPEMPPLRPYFFPEYRA